MIVLNQVSGFVAGWVYLKYYYVEFDAEGEELKGNNKIEADMLWSLLQWLSCLFWVSSCVAFISLIDWEYLGTFITTMTGPQYCIHRFRVATTEIGLLSPFFYHEGNDEVKEFLQKLIDENWDDWMKDRLNG